MSLHGTAPQQHESTAADRSTAQQQKGTHSAAQGNAPQPSFKLEVGQCTMEAPVAAKRAISASVACVMCAAMSLLLIKPSRSRFCARTPSGNDGINVIHQKHKQGGSMPRRGGTASCSCGGPWSPCLDTQQGRLKTGAGSLRKLSAHTCLLSYPSTRPPSRAGVCARACSGHLRPS